METVIESMMDNEGRGIKRTFPPDFVRAFSNGQLNYERILSDRTHPPTRSKSSTRQQMSYCTSEQENCSEG